MGLLLGYDVGSSSIKATLMDSETGQVVGSATSPDTEMKIVAQRPGWAEQDPAVWWDNIKVVTAKIRGETGFDPGDIRGIGIAYQMHGLVVVDRNHAVLRPSIIWCDSRAVDIGARALEAIGSEQCLTRMLNSPGNFTASKLKWVRDNEPDTYALIHKAMLPGDYIALRLTGEITTTPSGLSEAILWDFRDEGVASSVLDHYGIAPGLLPDIVNTFSEQGAVTPGAAAELGLAPGTPVAYRAGDQPNNAMSLNVLSPGEVAATAGTSGVVYGISDRPDYDPRSRVNTFVHVNHSSATPRYGVLLCVNGTGILNSWLKHNVAGSSSYAEMDAEAKAVAPGCGGLVVLPYGNGAERTLANADIGASVHGLNFNIHTRAHLFRAAQEGIAFALNYGLEIMQGVGVTAGTIRAGYANMFLSPVFAEAFSTVSGACLELYDTDGSQGAARAAGVGAGVYGGLAEAMVGLRLKRTVEPEAHRETAFREAYANWAACLQSAIPTQERL